MLMTAIAAPDSIAQCLAKLARINITRHTQVLHILATVVVVYRFTDHLRRGEAYCCQVLGRHGPNKVISSNLYQSAENHQLNKLGNRQKKKANIVRRLCGMVQGLKIACSMNIFF